MYVALVINSAIDQVIKVKESVLFVKVRSLRMIVLILSFKKFWFALLQ